MAADWSEKTLEQLGRIVTGKTPSSTVPGFFGGRIPFVTPTDLNGRRILRRDTRPPRTAAVTNRWGRRLDVYPP
jgi:type I restriction enzyme S subunit